jgi:hypothetical protein
MIIVKKQNIALFYDRANRIRENLVHPLISVPIDLGERNLARMVMKQRPEDRVGEAVVVLVCEVVGDEDGDRRVFVPELGLDGFLFLGRYFQALTKENSQLNQIAGSESVLVTPTRPSNPGERHLLLQPRQRRYEPPRRHRKLPSIV